MSPELLDWIEAAHTFGVILWVAGLFACLRLLRAHAAGGGSAAAETARSTALSMDLGAALAIAAGVAMLVGITPSPIQEGWMHIKLTLVVVGILSTHGVLRAKIKKARNGKSAAIPAFFGPFAIVIVAAVVSLVVTKPI